MFVMMGMQRQGLDWKRRWYGGEAVWYLLDSWIARRWLNWERLKPGGLAQKKNYL